MKQVQQQDACDLAGSSGAVVLAVAIGDGQVGTSLVIVDGTPVAAGTNLSHVLLGQAEQLSTKTAVITSTISQTNANSEHFSVVHDVIGSQAHRRFIVTEQFDGSDSASVTETITFGGS